MLKSDDDQSIDTLQLPTYINYFVPDANKELFYLCTVVEGASVQRDKSSKHFVTEDEFEGKTYPTYCAGWAYVTNVPTITRQEQCKHQGY